MHPLSATFVASLHPSTIDADARQLDPVSAARVAARQRLMEVRLGSQVTLDDHFRTDLYRRLVQSATGEFDTADLSQHQFANRV